MSDSKTFLSISERYSDKFDLVGDLARDEIHRELRFSTAKRLRAIADRAGMDIFVQTAGRSSKQVGRYLNGDKPPLEVLEAICREFKVSIGWIANGEVGTETDRFYETRLLSSAGSSRLVAVRKPKPESDLAILHYGLKAVGERLAAVELLDLSGPKSTQFPSTSDVTDLNMPGMISIPRYDEVRPSAGHGSVATSELPTTRVAFERNWLIDLGIAAESAVILPAQGDSMEPTIMNGSPMLVDTSKKEVRNGFIYVFDIDGDLVVKRIERLPDGSFDLISDNSNRYPTRTLTRETVATMTVVGRVYAAVSKF